MDERDGEYSDDFNKLSINSFDENLFCLNEKSKFDSLSSDNGNDYEDADDTIDSMNILSKLNLRNFGNSKRIEPPKPPNHLNPKFVPKLFSKSNDHCYYMNHKQRGKCIIINNTYFDSPTLPERKGTQVDRERLTNCFKSLDFDIENWDEQEAFTIQRKIDNLSKQDFTDHDCLVVCVLTHGDANCLYAKDEKYYVEHLFDSFKSDLCKTLAGKPKIFIIQACRGDRLDNGSIINFDVEDSNTADVRIPQWADFLMAYSTIPGYYSWRNTTNGSWFIQAFITALTEYHKELDLVSILTVTNQKVAYDFESNTPNLPDFHQRKQIPMIASMLTRKVYFNKPKPKKILKVTSEAKSTTSSSSSSSSSARIPIKEELLKQQAILNEKIRISNERLKNCNKFK